MDVRKFVELATQTEEVANNNVNCVGCFIKILSMYHYSKKRTGMFHL